VSTSETRTPFPGALCPDLDTPGLRAWLLRLPAVSGGEEISGGKVRVIRFADPVGGLFPMAVKIFPPERVSGRLQPSAAERAYESSLHLHRHGVPTPRPVAWILREQGNLLVTEFLAGRVSMREALRHHYFEQPLCSRILEVLQRVADTVRAMHACGFEHRDLGNQNLMLDRLPDGSWGKAWLIDLNRGRIRPSLSDARRGRDNSRIDLPSDLLRVFLEMQHAPHAVPEAFLKAEKRERARYQLHVRTRPLRRIGRGVSPPARPRLPEKDIWIWDDRSMQAIPALRSRDKRKYYEISDAWEQARVALKTGKARRLAQEELLGQAWTRPVALRGRIGLSLNLEPERFEKERRWLTPLGPLPLLVRLYHHENESRRRFAIEAVRKLGAEGHPVAVALVQDRRATLFPEKWGAFVDNAAAALSGFVEAFEVGHAINRVKWGIWNYAEYEQLLKPFAGWEDRFPQIPLWGPSGIDFELLRVAPLLDRLPAGLRFQAFSHHMYVDRRGAPENEQAGRDTVAKLAALRALARTHPACAERVIITEVNWPLLGTGVWSPVGSPYESPGPRHNDPSVDEETYAAYMIRYLLLALGSGMAERVYWWNLAAHGFGLIDDRDPKGWRPRPAYHAFQEWLQWSRGAEILGRVDAGDARSYALSARGETGEERITWRADSRESPLRHAIPGGGEADKP